MWRTVVVRLELLRSLLNVDLVGFLMFEYTRNFLTCCKRMLALEHEFQKGGALGIEYEGRHVMLQVCTFGISPQQLEARLDKVPVEPPSLGPGTLWDVCSGGRVVIGAIDYLDRLKGVAPKLLAWEALLRDYPHYRKGHVLVQVCRRQSFVCISSVSSYLFGGDSFCLTGDNFYNSSFLVNWFS